MTTIPCGDCIDWFLEPDDNTTTTGECLCPHSPHFGDTRLDTDDGCEFAYANPPVSIEDLERTDYSEGYP
jgi:hypothetical protein